jgi:hypothetical protein
VTTVKIFSFKTNISSHALKKDFLLAAKNELVKVIFFEHILFSKALKCAFFTFKDIYFVVIRLSYECKFTIFNK